jgi:ATP-dependent RNA helicase DeaD
MGVDRLTEELQRQGVGAEAIHGDLRQGQRDRVMADFRSGSLEFLVATNVAARGLDIPDIQHVINFDVPQNPDEYIHRVGRTARAGKKGSAVTFVGEWELDEWDAILRLVGAAEFEQIVMPSRWA